MEKKFSRAWRVVLLLVMMAVSVDFAYADNKNQTPEEFAAEGIDKAVEVMNDMVVKLNELDRAEQVQELESIMNSIKFRNVRKKYGKIELTDEHRVRLIEANVAVSQALMDYITRASLPFELRQMLEQHASKEKITEEINKAKTLREAMS